jgi:hypothetical protein
VVLLAAIAVVAPALAAPVAVPPSVTVQSQPADATGISTRSPHLHAIPLLGPDPEELRARKAAAGRGGGAAPSSGGTSAPATETAVFNGLNAPGLRAVDNSAANNGTPPDTTGAIGPNHYVEFVNSKVAVYSRSNLGSIAQRDLDAFVGRSGENVFDPQIQWDPQANRWLYLSDDIGTGSKNFLAFGWSKTADPSDLVNGWCRFVVSTDIGGKFFDDYPKLGHDNNHIIFGTNVYSNVFFYTAHIWSVPKPAAGTTCTAPSLTVFGSPTSPLSTADGDPAFTPVPANTADSSTNGYVVAADSPEFVASPSQLMTWHVGGTATSPTLTQDGNIGVSCYDVPANVPQPGTSKVLDSLDTRLTQAVAHADPDAPGGEAVWTQHTINGPGGRSQVRWYELLPASTSVRQQGAIQDASNFVFNGAISPAMNGNSAVVHYNVGGSSLLAQIRAQSRQGATPLGQVGDELTLGTSAAADQDFSCVSPYGPPCRWGDYAGASPDPANADVVWGSSQLNDPFTSDPHWATRNFAIAATPAAGYVRPKGASPVIVALVPAENACTAANSTHGAPLASPSCNPPVPASSFLTVGTPDVNGNAANAAASVRMDAVIGDPATGTDEADDKLTVTFKDVRRKSDLGDYGGALQASIEVRITDRYNGASLSDPGTVSDLTYAFTVPCATNGDPAIGSTCAVNTSADALVPDTIREGKRAIWELDQVRLFDGGSDGVATTTADNTLFAVEGIFIP